ncbi:MAG: polymerase, sigma-24 subunit, subfamily, partial [Nitrospira sp.]|nr:polymerase, sigma-24 subunit, subfamily [Nitrospira sp.]
MNADLTTYTESIGHNPSISRGSQTVTPSGLTTGEGAFIERLRRGDEGAFEELVNRQHSTLLRMAMGYVADREVRSSLRTWICGILIHKAKDRGVREKRHTTFSDFESSGDDNGDAVDPSRIQQSGEWAGHWACPPQPWDDQTPEKLLANRQAVNAMQRALEALPAILKEVLILRDVEGVEAQE